MYRRIGLVLCLSLAIITAPSAYAVHDAELLAVPTATGIISGCIYGSFLKNGQWIALLLSNILLGRIKDRVFTSFDKDHRAATNAKQLLSMFSLTCESTKDTNGATRSTYIINVNDDKSDAPTRYTAMSDFDDLITLVTTLVTMAF